MEVVLLVIIRGGRDRGEGETLVHVLGIRVFDRVRDLAIFPELPLV